MEQSIVIFEFVISKSIDFFDKTVVRWDLSGGRSELNDRLESVVCDFGNIVILL